MLRLLKRYEVKTLLKAGHKWLALSADAPQFFIDLVAAREKSDRPIGEQRC